MALALTVKYGESIVIGDNIEVYVKKSDKGAKAILVVIAPREIYVDRKEIRLEKERILKKERLNGARVQGSSTLKH